MILKRFMTVFIFMTLLLITSCLDVATSDAGIDQDLTVVIEKQELFEKKLNQIVKKIDDLQTSVNKIKTAPPSAADNKKNEKPKRKSADPNYVHNIPQGDSYYIGNPNAVVTITEFFDFQ